MDGKTEQRDMVEQTNEYSLLKKMGSLWFVIKKEGTAYRLFDDDASHCLDSDDGSFVEFRLEKDETGNRRARLVAQSSEMMSWEQIEEWYGSDNYPPFGGPFTDALTTFEWLKMNFEPPRVKRQKEDNTGGGNE